MISFLPVSLIKYTGGEGGKDDMENLLNGDFKGLPRLYKVLLGTKLVRVGMLRQILRKILKKTHFQMDMQDLMMTQIDLMILLHLIANFWATAATFS